VALHGFPRELLRMSEREDQPHLLAHLYFAGGTVAGDDWPLAVTPPLDPTRDIVIDYSLTGRVPGDPRGRRIPDVEGVSGAGIWSFGSHTDGIWSPECSRLIGIDRSWVSGKRLLFATQIQHWLECLRDDCPGLAGAIAAVRTTPPES
jgi:hypothetical protein